MIAALASGLAAVVVSRFWQQGTILASAMTPVVVAIVSELLRKPVESERIRGSVKAVSSYSRPRSGRTPRVLAPPAAGVDEGLERREDGVEAGPVRVYSSGSTKGPGKVGGPSPRRRLHLKVAVVTGLIGFLIAAAVLTLPELIFGGSVSGGSRSTTYFGGGSGSQEKGESQDGNATDGQKDAPADQSDQPGSTSPGDQQDPSGGSSSGGSTTPETSPSSPPPSEESPSPTPAPPQQTPAPSAPVP